MRVQVGTIEVSDEQRKALRKASGMSGMATRAEVRELCEGAVRKALRPAPAPADLSLRELEVLREHGGGARWPDGFLGRLQSAVRLACGIVDGVRIGDDCAREWVEVARVLRTVAGLCGVDPDNLGEQLVRPQGSPVAVTGEVASKGSGA